MARAVKCIYCGQFFDRDVTEYVQVGKRFAHANCKKIQDEKIESAKLVVQSNRDEHKDDYREVMDFAKKHFGEKANYSLIQQQISRLINENGYSYSGIYKALIYYYDILKKPIDKSNGGIGIVKYIYEEARKYYYTIWAANKNNENKKIKEEIEEVHYKPRERKINRPKFFTFLDKEGNIDK